MSTSSGVGLVVTTLLASAVEFVEAFTIVLAMGITRGWRSALAGTALAVVSLAGDHDRRGLRVDRMVPGDASCSSWSEHSFSSSACNGCARRSCARPGSRGSMTRSRRSVRKPRRRAFAGDRRKLGLDWFGFVVSFKGVLPRRGSRSCSSWSRSASMPTRWVSQFSGRSSGGVIVLVAGVLAHRPLARVPGEHDQVRGSVSSFRRSGRSGRSKGSASSRAGRASIDWPGEDLRPSAILAVWCAM